MNQNRQKKEHNIFLFHRIIFELVDIVHKKDSPFTKIVLSNSFVEPLKKEGVLDTKRKTIYGVPYIIDNNIFGMYVK